jgi:hypothetical protein
MLGKLMDRKGLELYFSRFALIRITSPCHRISSMCWRPLPPFLWRLMEQPQFLSQVKSPLVLRLGETIVAVIR